MPLNGTSKELVIIGLNIRLWRIQWQAIFWTNAEMFPFRPSETNYSISIQLWQFYIKKFHWNYRRKNNVRFVQASLCEIIEAA